MKKNAFTLVEMLAVIVILGLLMVITFPKILEMIGKEEDNISIAQTSMIKSAVKSYLFDNSNIYLARQDNKYCISLSTLENEGYLAIDSDELDLTKSAYIEYTSDEQYNITIGDCKETTTLVTEDLAGLSCRVDKTGYAVSKTVTISYPQGKDFKYYYKIGDGNWKEVDSSNAEQVKSKIVTKLTFDTNTTIYAKVEGGDETVKCSVVVTDIDSTKIGTILKKDDAKIKKGGYLETDGSLVERSQYSDLYYSLDLSKVKPAPNSTTFYLPEQADSMIKVQ